MPIGAFRRAAAVCGVVAVLPFAACSSDIAATNGDILARSARGDLSVHGGARRVDGDQSRVIGDAINDSGVRNVILLIGDGMGDSELTMARNYVHGAGGSFPGIDALPLTGQYTHYALNKDGSPNYVTDSAASASAWATGTKTYNGALSIDIHDQPQRTLLELAKANGLATGNVTTTDIGDATPAAQVAHITNRRCYGPVQTLRDCRANALESGGAGSIIEQLLNARADVTLGGGAETFAQTAGAGEYQGKTLRVQAKERGYNIVTTAEGLAGVNAADQNTPLLGLFSESHMPTSWTGPKAVRSGYLQAAVKCAPNPGRADTVPTLVGMTQKAIDLLRGDRSGFFLQVESGSIDKQSHAGNPCGQIGETEAFDQAVQKALDFAKQDGSTLVIVTADHAHTGQIVGNVTEQNLQAIAERDHLPFEIVRDTVYPGLTRKLRTADNADMTVSYGTSTDSQLRPQSHTGTQLRIAAFGPRAANVVGLTDQTDLFFTMAEALGLNRDTTTGN